MKIKIVSASEMDELIEEGKGILVDIRSGADYQRKHIGQAINIPLESIASANFDRKKVIIVYCERGSRSFEAAKILLQKGYDVRSLLGGLAAYRGRFVR